jgi:hypothetical protein
MTPTWDILAVTVRDSRQRAFFANQMASLELVPRFTAAVHLFEDEPAGVKIGPGFNFRISKTHFSDSLFKNSIKIARVKI